MDDFSRSVHPYPPDVTSEVHDVHVADHNGRQISGGSWVCCMPCYWLRTNSSLHKASLTVVTLLVTSLLVASPVLFLISNVPANEQPYKDCSNIDDVDCFVDKTWDVPLPLCDTLDCVDIARRIRLSLSWNRDPCKDFFSFACGSWGEHPKHLEDDLSFSAVQHNINKLVHHLIKTKTTTGRFKKVGDFYLSCLSALSKPADMSQMYKVLDQLGGYLPPGSIGPSDLTSLFINILKVSGAPLFDVYVTQDLLRKPYAAIFIDLPKDIKFIADTQENFFPDVGSRYRSFEKIKASKPSSNYKYIKDKDLENKLYRLESIVSGMLPKGMLPALKGSEIQQILLFATAIEQLQPRKKDVQKKVYDTSYTEIYTVERLQENFPFVTWKVLLDELMPELNVSEYYIYLTSKTYLTAVSELVTRFQNRVIHNALLAMYARDFLYTIANLTTVAGNHQPFCNTFTMSSLSRPVSALYLTHYSEGFLDEVQKAAENVFQELKRSLFNLVERAVWLDDSTRWSLMDKLTNMKALFIAWPPLRNATFVDELMNSLNVTDNFFDNMLNQFRVLRILQVATSNNGTQISWPSPFVVNSFYYPDINEMIVPLALLTTPHFTDKVPQYVVYGTIGLIMSHEMMHALDFNTLGHTVSPLWAQSRALKVLKTKLACLARSYQTSSQKVLNFMGKRVQVEFDGNSTLDENAADLGAVRIAWETWWRVAGKAGGESLSRLPLPPSRLFFLFSAQLYCSKLSAKQYIVNVENDSHMTAPERVNGMLRNTAAFAEAFQCPVGSSMNPSRKCTIW